MKIAITSDHAGYAYKEELRDYLKCLGHTVLDRGPTGPGVVDYPDYAHPVARMMLADSHIVYGVMLCGTGNGMALVAGQYEGLRTAVCWGKEIARLARAHNDANVLCLPARFLSFSEIENIMDTFLRTPFEGGRHIQRLHKVVRAHAAEESPSL